MEPFEIRGFNPCESLLRHTPEQLRRFIRRMKTLNLNTIIIHYDYGWKRYQKLILEECATANVNIILMAFGPRTFLRGSDWKKEWFARNPDGKPYLERLECETYPCRFQPEALEAYAAGAREWLKSLPPQIHHVHMRAADGIMFCQCEKCRLLPDHEKWQPFVDIFADAVQEVRSDLDFETDIYVKRYHIPENHAPFRAMKNIMYDTFYRNTNFPLGYAGYPDESVQWARSAYDTDADSVTSNEYHLKRLKEWTNTFPGKVYIHENAMAQGLHGCFNDPTSSLLTDLETFRKIGVQGVCYEAYEPGYIGFAPMFELLAKALAGEQVEWAETPAERFRRANNVPYNLKDSDGLESLIKDPFAREHFLNYRNFCQRPLLKNARNYLNFVFDHEDVFDPLFIGFSLAQSGVRRKVFSFRETTPEEEDFLHRRKLWDFMEDVPEDQNPREICRRIIFSLFDKVTR